MEPDFVTDGRTAPRNGTVTALATAAVVLIAAGVLAITFRSTDNGATVSSAQLVSLIRSASSALKHEPASSFRMTEVISADGQQQTIQMSGVSNNRDHASTFTMTGPGFTEGAIAVHGVAYIEVPASRVAENLGKPWLAVRAAGPTPAQRDLANEGPAGLLQALDTVGGTIDNLGTQDVEGVSTTEYGFHADLLKLFGPTFTKIFGTNTVSELQALGFDHLPMKLWMDKDGLPRKFSLDFTVRGVSIDEVGYVTPTKVIPKIEPPPASEVRMVHSESQFGEVLRQLAGL